MGRGNRNGKHFGYERENRPDRSRKRECPDRRERLPHPERFRSSAGMLRRQRRYENRTGGDSDPRRSSAGFLLLFPEGRKPEYADLHSELQSNGTPGRRRPLLCGGRARDPFPKKPYQDRTDRNRAGSLFRNRGGTRPPVERSDLARHGKRHPHVRNIGRAAGRHIRGQTDPSDFLFFPRRTAGNGPFGALLPVRAGTRRGSHG